MDEYPGVDRREGPGGRVDLNPYVVKGIVPCPVGRMGARMAENANQRATEPSKLDQGLSHVILIIGTGGGERKWGALHFFHRHRPADAESA